jgi:hypothetical protein
MTRRMRASRRKPPDSSESSIKMAKSGRKEDTRRSRPTQILLLLVGAIAAVWLITKLINSPNSKTATQPVTTGHADKAALHAEASFRQYLGWRLGQPVVTPGSYVTALEEISRQGSTMLLSLAIRDYDGAVKLCNMAFVDWPAREEQGIRRVKVVLSSSRYSILAESTRKASGEEICR